jgi:hypothetical protein
VEPPSEIGRPGRERDDVTQRAEPGADPIGSTVYQIRLRGQLGPLWSDWFDGLAITWDGADTLLTGEVIDQSALYGVIRRIRDLGVTLISINRLEAGAGPDQGTNQIGED